MPTYHIKLTNFKINVDVPLSVRGLDNVAVYITDELASKYAHTLRKTREKAAPDNWSTEELDAMERKRYQSYYDSHKPSIIGLLLDMKSKLPSPMPRISYNYAKYWFVLDWTYDALEGVPRG